MHQEVVLIPYLNCFRQFYDPSQEPMFYTLAFIAKILICEKVERVDEKR